MSPLKAAPPIARPTSLGHKRTYRRAIASSASPPIATAKAFTETRILRAALPGRFNHQALFAKYALPPKADIERRVNNVR